MNHEEETALPEPQRTPAAYRRDLLLNQYQGGMSISGVLKTISRTPRRLTSPLRPNWGRPAVRSSDMHISPWLQFRAVQLFFQGLG